MILPEQIWSCQPDLNWLTASQQAALFGNPYDLIFETAYASG